MIKYKFFCYMKKNMSSFQCLFSIRRKNDFYISNSNLTNIYLY